MPNDPSPDDLFNQAIFRLSRFSDDSQSGYSATSATGWVPIPLTDEEAQRLFIIFDYGFEVFTSGIRPTEDELNPYIDEVTKGLIGKMGDLINVGELKGGTVLFTDDCPNVTLISITAARALETSSQKLFCLPPIPPGETEEETAARIALENVQKWLLVHIPPLELWSVIQDGINQGSITDTHGKPITIPDFFGSITDGLSGGGSGSTDSDGNPIPPPGPGSGDGHTPADGDVSVALPTCVEIDHHGPGAGGFSYAPAPIRTAITNAAASTGKFDPEAEELVSVKLFAFGRCYTGIFGSANLGPVTGPLGHPALPLKVKDAEHNFEIFPYSDIGATATIEASPPSGVELPPGSATLTAGARVIEGTVGVPMLPTSEEIYLYGELPQLPGWLAWALNTVLSAGPTAIVYLTVQLCSFVKRLHLPDCWKPSPHSNGIDSLADCQADCLPDNDPGGNYITAYGGTWRPSASTLFQVYHDKATNSVDFSFHLGSGSIFDPTTGRDYHFRAQRVDTFPSPGHIDVTVHVTGDYSGSNYSQIPVSGHIDFPVNLPRYKALQFFILDAEDVNTCDSITLNEP